MSILKIKSIGLLAASVLFSSEEAIAEDHWGVGVKVSGSTSFTKQSTEFEKEFKKEHQQHGIDIDLSTNYFNPWFGVAIYSEFAFFNDRVGIGAEMLYNRFTFSGIGDCKAHADSTPMPAMNLSRVTDTIAFPLTFGLYWTSFIRPDFKDDYFLARFFLGICPVFCLRDKETVETTGKKLVDQDWTTEKDYKRTKLGFIGGHSFEFPNGLLLELKGLLPYNLYAEKQEELRPFVTSFHLSLGYNFAKLLEN